MSGTSFVQMSHELTWETYCKGSQLSFINAYISTDAMILHIRRAGMIEQQIVLSSPHHNKDIKIIFPKGILVHCVSWSWVNSTQKLVFEVRLPWRTYTAHLFWYTSDVGLCLTPLPHTLRAQLQHLLPVVKKYVLYPSLVLRLEYHVSQSWIERNPKS